MVLPHGYNIKKNGQPKRTMYLQWLNTQCQWETHHTSHPFHTACQIPPETKKSVRCNGCISCNNSGQTKPSTHHIYHWVGQIYVFKIISMIHHIRLCVNSLLRWNNKKPILSEYNWWHIITWHWHITIILPQMRLSNNMCQKWHCNK